MSSQNSVSSTPIASAVAASSGPVTSGTPSATNSQVANAPVSAARSVAVGIGKNVMNRGKGGKLGGKLSALRHAGMNKQGITGYSRPRHRQAAARGGCKAVSNDAYVPMDEFLEDKFMTFMKNSLCYSMHSRRKTLVKMDSFAACNRMGYMIYS